LISTNLILTAKINLVIVSKPNNLIKEFFRIFIWSGALGFSIAISEALFNNVRNFFLPEQFDFIRFFYLTAHFWQLYSVRSEIMASMMLGVLLGSLSFVFVYLPLKLSKKEFARQFALGFAFSIYILLLSGFNLLKVFCAPNCQFYSKVFISPLLVICIALVIAYFYKLVKNRIKLLKRIFSRPFFLAFCFTGFIQIWTFQALCLNLGVHPKRWLYVILNILFFFLLFVLGGSLLDFLQKFQRPKLLQGRLYFSVIWLVGGFVVYYHFWGAFRLPIFGNFVKGAPNVVLIVMDTVRKDHLSLYGYKRKTSPFLDFLSQYGAKFVNAYTSSPWTLPSHASFFTGLYPSEHQAINGNEYLDSDYKTIAEALSERGYLTLGISSNPWISSYSNLDQGFKVFIESWPERSPQLFGQTLWKYMILATNAKAMLWDDGGAKATRIARRWIRKLSSRGVSFFLFINYMEAHLPYPYHPMTYHFFSNPKEASKKLEQIHFDWIAFDAGKQSLSESQKEMLKSWYDGCIYYIDQRIKEVVKELVEARLFENTILIVLSDHGEGLGDHGIWAHEFGLYKNLINVPLLVVYPRLVPAGKEVDGFFSLKDLPELIFELLGGRRPKIFYQQNSNNSVLIFSERYPPKRLLVTFKTRFADFNTYRYNREERSVIKYPYHLIWYSNGGDELFDLSQDPNEEINLIGSNSQLYQELSTEILLFRSKYRAKRVGAKKPKITNVNAKRMLRSLGYIR